MNYPIVSLKSGRDIPIKAGHPWIFSQGIADASDKLQPGDIVTVVSSGGTPLGLGFYNPHCAIRIRMFTRDSRIQFNESFLVERLKCLGKLKESRLQPETTGYRWVYAESDSLPGLIVDKFNKTVVFQIHTAGMEANRAAILRAIQAASTPDHIVERSDVGIRKEEGLTTFPVSVHHGSPSGLEPFTECGIHFGVDPIKGQKTGFFLDQRDARKLLTSFSLDKKVLNLFSYTGGFSLAAARGGACNITSVDISRPALDTAKRIFELNQLPSENYEFFATDAFKFIDTVPKGNYDIIVCDPPAFAKSGAKLSQATEGYIRINKKCLEKLSPGQLLLTSSCSGRITHADFEDIIRKAATAAGKQARILHRLGQATCHTERLSFPEGQYLKTLLIEVIN